MKYFVNDSCRMNLKHVCVTVWRGGRANQRQCVCSTKEIKFWELMICMSATWRSSTRTSASRSRMRYSQYSLTKCWNALISVSLQSNWKAKHFSFQVKVTILPGHRTQHSPTGFSSDWNPAIKYEKVISTNMSGCV